MASQEHGAIFSIPGIPKCALADQAMNILVTGASGFVGQALCVALAERFNVRAALRSARKLGRGHEQVVVGPVDRFTDWASVLNGQDVVIHLAARVHVMREIASDPLREFREVNVEGSLQLARQAARAGVKRMLFVSSVKVNGETSPPGKGFVESDTSMPVDFYGLSKLEAEDGLREIAKETGLEVVIIRPPLIYGPGVKANFAALVRAVKRGLPLPLGAVHNQRSLVGLDNLVNFLITCATHPEAASHTFFVSDGHDLSTPELIKSMAEAAQVPARLFHIPVWLLEAGATLVGKREVVRRLCSDLQVDISKAQRVLGWSPPFSVEEGLRQTVEATATQ
jgi:nucleoside-diphosphate-sugar epimerase